MTEATSTSEALRSSMPSVRKQQPVAGLAARAPARGSCAAGACANGGSACELISLGAPVADADRRRMAGVDDARRRRGQVDAHELAGDEGPARRRSPPAPRGRCAACSASPTPRRRALRSAPTSTRRQQRRVERVAHGVGHRQMQRVALEAEVEGVAADVPRRLQPPGQRELPGLAGVGAGEQAVLDLGLQRQRHRALAPFEQVGEAAVGDHDVGQRVRCARRRRPASLVRRVVQRPAPGPRPPRRGWSPARTTGCRRRRRTTSTCCSARARPCGVPLSGTVSARSRPMRAVGLPRGDVAEADQRLPAVVGDQEADIARPERLAQGIAEHLRGCDRRGGSAAARSVSMFSEVRRIHRW